MNPLDRMRSLRANWQLPGSGGTWLAVSLVVLFIEIALSIVFWNWLSGGESASTTIRNVGLVIAGSVALPLAIWRGVVADRQASAAQRQVDAAQQSLLNERYQKGAEMLGSEVLSVRMGGVYALERLAREHPKQYHIQIMALFCAFVRRPPNDEESNPRMAPDDTIPPLRQDVQAVVAAVAARGKSRLAIEQEARTLVDPKVYAGDAGSSPLRTPVHHQVGGYVEEEELRRTGDFYFDPLFALDLRHADLRGVWLRWGGNLAGARLDGADLSHADLTKMNLSRTHFNDAILSGAELTGTNLTGARLMGADLSRTISERADLSGAELHSANLSGAWLQRANMSDAVMWSADLSGANLRGADLSDASLLGAILSGADLYGASPADVHRPVIGLTQAQLDEARADPANPPKLGGIVQDAETGEPLVWRGESHEDEA